MVSKNVCIFGCKKTTSYIIDSLINSIPINNVITISPQKNEKINIPDYHDLNEYYIGSFINVHQVNRYDLNDEKDISIINSLDIDIAFVIGWQRLIPKIILDKVRHGVYGMHGSSEGLPKGRGRSPLNWSIIEGRKNFTTNLFKYTPYIDDGEIVGSIEFEINNNDTCETLHFKNMISMKNIIRNNYESILGNNIKLKPQKKINPSYYPKREPNDSQINWDSNIIEIERLIRAVTTPFNGSFSFLKDSKFIIYEAQIFDTIAFEYDEYENGTIAEIFNNDKILINCLGGTLLVKKFQYMGEFKVGDRLKTKKHLLKTFKKNNKGYFDI